jgi:hypothetical protein
MRATSKRSHITKAAVATAVVATVFFSPPTVLAHDSEDHGPREGDVQKLHELIDFDKIDIRGIYRLKVTVGEEFRVFTSGAAKEVKDMKVYREGRALVLDQKRKSKKLNGNNRGVWAEISLPALNVLDVSGVGTGDVTGVDAKVFEINVKGVGDLEITGRCGVLDAIMKGVGSIEAGDLKCEKADVALKGVGSVSLFASEAVDISAKGIGSVDVYGKPKTVDKSNGFLSGVTVY